MAQTVIRLRYLPPHTLRLEIPNPEGGTEVVVADPEQVQEMYRDLATVLPPIFADFEDPAPGESGQEFPYPTPVNALSSRVPEELRNALDALVSEDRGGGAPVLLIAEDDPFPWEVVRPRPESRMLGQVFDLARFDGVCTELTVDVPGLLVIAPTPTDDRGQCDVTDGLFRDQFHVVREYFLPNRFELLDCEQATRNEVLDRLRQSDERIVHYMGHHFFNSREPAKSWLQLAGGEGMSPEDVAEEVGNAPAKWPWVFLNCCKASAVKRLDDDFGEAGTRWGSVLRDAGSRMTVGPYWRVDKRFSGKVARTFFQHVLGDNWTVGAAMRELRANPRPPTMLAYTLVGDPTLKVRVAPG